MKLKSWIFLILFIFSFILSVFLNYDKIRVPYFGGLYKGVWVDTVYFDNKDLKLIDFNGISYNTLKITENHYLYKISSFKKVKKINISNPEKIKQIILYIDKKAQYDSFDNINNSKNLFDSFAIIILSFFYNFYLYLFSYLFLFLFLYNFKGKISTAVCFWIIFAVSVLLRLAQLNSVPFWDDEIYVLKITAGYSPLIQLFNDPGNPPLYFILFKIYRTIVQNPLFYRFSSVIIGSIFCFIFYLYVKKFTNSKNALIALSFSALSLTLIYFSQEIRCYMLLMLLAVISSYFLFKQNKKYYLITSIALLYTHFYGAFYLLYNSLFSLFYFKKRKKKDFLILNLIAFLSFIPVVIYKIKSITTNFNTWLSVPNVKDYIHLIKTFSGFLATFIILLILLFFVFKKSPKRKKIFICYNFFAIFFVVIFAIIFSYAIKPIFLYRYMYVIYPCYVALCAILTSDIKLSIISFIVFVSQGILGYQILFCNHNLYIDFIKHDIDKNKKNYVFMTDTVQGYKEFLIDGAEIIYIQVNTGLNTLNPLDYGVKKPSNCYVLNLYLDSKTYKEAKDIELYKTPVGVFSRIEY